MNENIFATSEELSKLNVGEIHRMSNGNCMFLQNGACTTYKNRPIECRLYPFDILLVDNEYTWVLWNIACSDHYTKDEMLEVVKNFESYVLHDVRFDYVKQYVSHHSIMQPEKYNSYEKIIIRKVIL